jgi:PAS domain S-box-containing protein
MGTGRDVTEQKPTEEHLRQTHQELQNQIAERGRREQRFRRVFDEGPLGMALFDMDRRIIEVNHALYEFLRYTEDELLGMDGNAITDADDIETSKEIAARFFRGEIASYKVGKRYVRKDGRSVWAMLTASLIRDVTEPRATLAARLQLASTVDASTDAIIRMDIEGTIVGWNTGAETMFGYTAEEMIGEHASKLAGPEQYEEQQLNSKAVLNGRPVIIPETVRVRKDGRPVDATASVFPLRNANGEVTGVAAISRDITEQLKLQRQSQEAQRMEATGELAGGVAHDVNNISDRHYRIQRPHAGPVAIGLPAPIESSGTGESVGTGRGADAPTAGVRPQATLRPEGPRVQHCWLRIAESTASDTLDHIFEPFFTTKERGEGTRLGLADDNAKVARGEGTVLLVEDDRDLNLLAARVLREKVYTVIEVTSPHHAEEVFDRTAVMDLVLTDVVMPDMSGPQLVEQLRSRGRDFK